MQAVESGVWSSPTLHWMSHVDLPFSRVGIKGQEAEGLPQSWPWHRVPPARPPLLCFLLLPKPNKNPSVFTCAKMYSDQEVNIDF